MPSDLNPSEGKIPIYTSKQERVGNVTDRMNPDRILSLTRANELLGGRRSGQRLGLLLVLRIRNYPWRMNQNLANGIKMRKGNRNIIFLGRSLIFTPRTKRISEHHSDGTLHFIKSEPDNKHAIFAASLEDWPAYLITMMSFSKFLENPKPIHFLQFYSNSDANTRSPIF